MTMQAAEKILVFNSIQELYRYLNLPVDKIDEKTEFAIHNLKDIHAELPYRSPLFKINYFSFLFVKNAKGRYSTDEQYFDTQPGTIYFTNPGHYKSFEWEKIEEVYQINLSESFLKENVHPNIFDEFSFLLAETVPPRNLTPEIFAEFEQLYLQILKEYISHSPYRNRLIGNLFVVLLLKIKEYFWHDYNPIYEGNRSSVIVKNFRMLLEKHYRDLSKGLVEKAYRVQDYADAQSLHPNYLNNVITTKTGKSVGTWIAEKTIAEAKSLLQNSSSSVKEISYLLGFSESTHFSNYFKKHTGISPVLYRNQHNKATF